MRSLLWEDTLIAFTFDSSLKLNFFYFFVLTQKSNKKSQGKPEASGRFALPTPHISFLILFLLILHDLGLF
jgi:hypothetical protein